MRKGVNFVEFCLIYLNLLEFTRICDFRETRDRRTDRRTDQRTNPQTDGQSLLYSCFSQLKSPGRFLGTHFRCLEHHNPCQCKCDRCRRVYSLKVDEHTFTDTTLKAGKIVTCQMIRSTSHIFSNEVESRSSANIYENEGHEPMTQLTYEF